MSSLTSDTGPREWRGMPFYDPTTYPPASEPEPPRPTLTYRLAAFGLRWITKTGSYVCLTLAIYVLATGQI